MSLAPRGLKRKMLLGITNNHFLDAIELKPKRGDKAEMWRFVFVAVWRDVFLLQMSAQATPNGYSCEWVGGGKR